MHRSVLFVVLVLVSSMGVGGEIHKWTDENGRVHFGDRPPPGVTAKSITVRPNVYESPSTERLSAVFSSNDGVVLYSTVWCVYCHQARAYFQSNGIPFAEYDVEKSRRGIRDYKRLGATGVPVILIGKKRLNGFSVDAFESVYETVH